MCAFLLLGLSADRAFMQYVMMSDIIQCAVFCEYGLCAFLLSGLSADRAFMQYVHDVGYHSVCYVPVSMGCAFMQYV